MGIIDNWKELGCDDQKLTWAHRSDGSGTIKHLQIVCKHFQKLGH